MARLDGAPRRADQSEAAAGDSERFDDQERTPLVWGKRSVLEHLRRGSALQRIYIQPEGNGLTREFFELAKEQVIPVVRTGRERLDSLTRHGNHQGVVAVLGERSFATWQQVEAAVEASGRPMLLLALEGVQDPGNFGALLRSAEGAGVQGVVVQAAGSCPLSATVSKTSAGADAYLPVARLDKLERTLEALTEEGVLTVATDTRATQLPWELDWTRPAVLVLGAEGSGLSDRVLQRCKARVRLPMLGQIESLNVSASAAAILYEAVRQRSTSR